MIDDAALAQFCAATYTSPPSLPVPKSGAYVCITQTDQGIVVACRGSVTPEDWWRDFRTFAIRVRHHPQLGFCHAGFMEAAESIVSAVRKAVRGHPFYVIGHSLGGAEAVAIGALLILAGMMPVKITTFGAPRVGMWKFVRVMIAVKELHQYRRGNDPVPDVPFFLPFVFRYRFTRSPLIQIGQDQADPFKCHSILGYQSDVQSLIASQPKV